jgi:hypothetical protein
MNKKIWLGILIVAVVALVAWYYLGMSQGSPVYTPPANATSTSQTPSTSTTAHVALPGERCGGNMTTAPTCTVGYHCVPDPGSHLPFGDVGGTCQPISAGGKG